MLRAYKINMIDVNKLQLIDGLAYALDDLQTRLTAEQYVAFTKWFGTRPHHLATDGRKCILASDLQLYIRLRTNALKTISTQTK